MDADRDLAVIVGDGWLRRERAELLKLLHRLEADDWRRPTECPRWDVKQVAVHVLGDDLSLLSRQRDQSVDGLSMFAATHPGASFSEMLNGFNEQWVTASAFLSTSVLIELLEWSGEQTATFYEQVDLSDLGEPVGFFGSTTSSPYWQIVAREFVERWTHQHQIRRATNNAVLGHDYLAVATGVFAHSIAMRLDDLGMPDGTTVTLQIPEVTAWTFRWTGDRSEWMLDSGINSAAVATILINAPTAIRLFTRGPVSVETADVITTSGDTSIANKALMAMGNVFS